MDFAMFVSNFVWSSHCALFACHFLVSTHLMDTGNLNLIDIRAEASTFRDL